MRNAGVAQFGASTGEHRPLVTVLTPTLNRRDLLAQTLASVHLQSYTHHEHLVLDGGSTDGSIELLRRAEDRWGVRWVTASDGGMYEALNKGLALAKGSLIGWVNDDDWLLPWTLEAVVATSNRHGPCAVFGDVLAVELGETFANPRVYSHFSRAALVGGAAIAQPTVFWPLAASQRVGDLDTATYRQIADCEYWLRLSSEVPFVRIDEFLALVQNHESTKRRSRPGQISAEFAQLNRQYGDGKGATAAGRVRDLVRARLAVTDFLIRHRHGALHHSRLLEPTWQSPPLATLLLRSGPSTRHPLANEGVDIGPLVDEFTRVLRELAQ